MKHKHSDKDIASYHVYPGTGLVICTELKPKLTWIPFACFTRYKQPHHYRWYFTLMWLCFWTTACYVNRDKSE